MPEDLIIAGRCFHCWSVNPLITQRIPSVTYGGGGAGSIVFTVCTTVSFSGKNSITLLNRSGNFKQYLLQALKSQPSCSVDLFYLSDRVNCKYSRLSAGATIQYSTCVSYNFNVAFYYCVLVQQGSLYEHARSHKTFLSNQVSYYNYTYHSRY